MREGLAMLAAVGGLALGLGCGGPERFVCQSDVQCVTDEVQGQCEVQGVCSFPDLGCESGQRFGDRAGELAGMCVEQGGTGSGSGTTTGTTAGLGSSSSSTADADTSGPGLDDVPSATTGPPVDDPYGPCEADEDCTHPDATCLPVGPTSVCAPPCSRPSSPSPECPPDPSMIASPACVDLGNGEVRCALSCLDSGLCPDGMVCEMLIDGAYCVWG